MVAVRAAALRLTVGLAAASAPAVGSRSSATVVRAITKAIR
jgi:hypothetical protein